MKPTDPWVLLLTDGERGPNYGFMEKLLKVRLVCRATLEGARAELLNKPTMVLIDGSFCAIEVLPLDADVKRFLTIELAGHRFGFLVNFPEQFDALLGGCRYGELFVHAKLDLDGLQPMVAALTS